MTAAFGKTISWSQKKELTVNVSHLIHNYMRKHKVNQMKLAEATGIPQSCISAMLSGVRPMSFYYAFILEVISDGELKAIELMPHYAKEIARFKELK